MKTKNNFTDHHILRSTWWNIQTRTNDKSNKNYGGRGIAVDDEWLGDQGYENFEKWALENGWARNLQLDRIDVNGNYGPTNCRWVTAKENRRNCRNTLRATIGTITKPIVEWAEITGIDYQQLRRALLSGNIKNKTRAKIDVSVVDKNVIGE